MTLENLNIYCGSSDCLTNLKSTYPEIFLKNELVFIYTLESRIYVAVRLFIFEKFWRKKMKSDQNALIYVEMN